jgi:hypothetical protein
VDAVRSKRRKRADWPSFSCAKQNFLSRHVARGWRCFMGSCCGGAQTCVLGRSQAELDNGTGVGDQFGLPAIVTLEFLHSRFSSSIPMSRGFAGEVTGLDQRGLDLSCTSVIDSALACGFCCRFRMLIEQLRRCGSATSVAKRRAWQCD